MAVNVLSRTDAVADVPPDTAARILSGAVEQSAAMRLFTTIPMNRRQERVRIETALPMAYWVSGDTGMKQTTKMAWEDKYLTAEEIAVILPIPENVLADADYDLWSYVQPRAEAAIGDALDAAIFFGVNAPATFPDDLVTAATAVSNVVARGTNANTAGGIVADFSDLYATVEDEGFDITGVAANRALRRYVRNARNAQGDRFAEVGPNGGTIDGVALVYAMRGLWPSTGTDDALAVTGDFTQGILGVRQDIGLKMLSEGVIQDPSDGSIAYNLAQQDMVALRLTARFGFQVANYVTREQSDDASRYPFAVLTT